MIVEKRIPGKAQSNIAREYYYLEIKEDQHNPDGRVVIDDACYDIIFFKEKKGYLTSENQTEKHFFKHGVFTIHNLKGPFRIFTEGNLTFFTIKLQPWLNGFFFRDLPNLGVIDVKDLMKACNLGKDFKTLNDQDSLFLQADKFIESLSISESPTIGLVREMCELIYQRNGIIQVQELSEIFDKSRQYLNRVFKNEVLYSLKHFILTVRILALIKDKLRDDTVSLTSLSYKYGYADQPHFNQDFKKICGAIPKVFFQNPPEFFLRHQ